MPRYFFHVDDGQDRPDLTGTDLSGDDAAKAHAVITSAEMMKDLGGAFWKSPSWEMTVMDREGNRVCILSVVGFPSRSVKAKPWPPG